MIESMREFQLKILFFLFAIFCFPNTLLAQQDSIIRNDTLIVYRTIDSIPTIPLDSIVLMPKIRFENYAELKKYRRLRKRILKVYPFAKLSGDNLEKLDERLARMKTKRQRRRYIRIVQKWIKKEFEPKLKKLSRKDAQILSKLMHRQTGETIYESLKKYRSGWTAFWYQRMAKMYDVDLKAKINPFEVKEDYWIEDILQRAFQDKLLEPQENKLGYKYLDLHNKWKPKSGRIDISKFINKVRQIKKPNHK